MKTTTAKHAMKQYELLPGEDVDIVKDAATVVADHRKWMEAPHDQLGGQTPRELVDAGREEVVRGLLRAIKHGMPT